MKPGRSPVTWGLVASAALFGACFDLDPTFGLEANQSAAGGTHSCDSAAGGGSAACVPDCSCQPPAPRTGDPYQDCVARINQFRACVCMEPLARNAAAEACADQEARFDSQSGVAHSGFTSAICAPRGVAQNECHGWPSVEQAVDQCTQAMFDEGPPPSLPCTDSCFETYGHFLNLTDPRHTSVACGFYRTATGVVWQTQDYFR